MNSNYEIKKDIGLIRINKEIYPKEVIIQTTYVLLEKYYFLIDIDKNYFIVQIKSKEGNEIEEKDILNFLDELVESQSYLDQLKRTKELRETILERAMLTQTLEYENSEEIEKENN